MIKKKKEITNRENNKNRRGKQRKQGIICVTGQESCPRWRSFAGRETGGGGGGVVRSGQS